MGRHRPAADGIALGRAVVKTGYEDVKGARGPLARSDVPPDRFRSNEVAGGILIVAGRPKGKFW